jgi:RNA processing factor Prp31
VAFTLENVSPPESHNFVGVPDKDMAAMELGLAHSLSRYKLKFSPDKIDTMIVQVAKSP